ncbi:hypothetical protein Tco_1166492 [Tanacetum coccineum]
MKQKDEIQGRDGSVIVIVMVIVVLVESNWNYGLPTGWSVFWGSAEKAGCILVIGLKPGNKYTVGRPTKARKKSAGEDIKMVNNGKLSRKSKTVTCLLCKSKGHNKRSCKGGSSNAGNKSGQSTAGNKRPRSETGNGNAQPAKKANTNAAVGVQTRSKAASQGSQLTTSGRKSVTKGKKKA